MAKFVTLSNLETFLDNSKNLFATKSEVGDGLLSKADSTHNHDDVYVAKENPEATGSLSVNRKADTTVGDYSVAIGCNNTASGVSSFAEGEGTTASGDQQHAQGRYNIEDTENTYAHIVGNGTSSTRSNAHTLDWEGNAWFAGDVTATDSEGNSVSLIDVASGDQYLYKENPVGTGSFSMNRKDDTTVGQYSVAMGVNATASGNFSHAEGSNTTASSQSSHAEGASTVASGGFSHAEGYCTNASGTGGHAEGYKTNASGQYSHAEGYETNAVEVYSHAEGRNTTASGMMAHAEGQNTTSSSRASHAEGEGTIASGAQSHAEGWYTTASGVYSHSEGVYTKASGKYQHVQGISNIEDTESTYAHIVGNGTSDTARSNAHTLDWEGNAWFAGDVQATDSNGATISLIELASGVTGDDYLVTVDPTGTGSLSLNRKTGTEIGAYSVALGAECTASADWSFATGYQTIASSIDSFAEGYQTVSSGGHSHAEGMGSVASGQFSHAEGDYTTASGQASHSEGCGTIAAGLVQHVQGVYNIEDAENVYLHIVGNGETNQLRSNAHTLDWSGNAWFAGDVTSTNSEGTSISLNSLAVAIDEITSIDEADIESLFV